MIEILYRGKTYNGVWATGFPLISDDREIAYIANLFCYNERIKPETLGRYTGITDKNGKRVFVGDILKDNDGKFCLVVEEETRIVLKKQDKRVTTWKYTHKKEIVGNIHDNPELLEGAK